MKIQNREKAVLTAFGKRLIGIVRNPGGYLHRPIFLAHCDFKPIAIARENMLPTGMDTIRKARFEHHGNWYQNKPVFDFVGFDLDLIT